jgi:dethiobiotin synthetase
MLRAAAAAAAASNGAGNGEGVGGRTVIVEGVGGLLAPLADEFTVCDLAVALGLPLLIAAGADLGTINHTLLTLQAARTAGLSVRAVVLTPWPEEPSRLQLSNRETITRLGFVEVETLARVRAPQIGELARAGAELPWRRWLDVPHARDRVSS